MARSLINDVRQRAMNTSRSRLQGRGRLQAATRSARTGLSATACDIRSRRIGSSPRRQNVEKVFQRAASSAGFPQDDVARAGEHVRPPGVALPDQVRLDVGEGFLAIAGEGEEALEIDLGNR